MNKRKISIVDRLLKRTKIPKNKDGSNSKSKCWIWQGPTNNAGYGMMRGRFTMGTVHRIMCVEHNKTIQYSSTKQVLHTCGEKLCVNPDHLLVGGNKERADLQRKYHAYNPMFTDKKFMWPVCEHCNGTTYLPHFKRTHSLCEHLAKHKYIAESISGNNR